MHLKTLRMQLRFLLPLVVTLVVAATLAVPLLDQVTLRWFSRDLNSRGLLVSNALSDSVAEALASGQTQRLRPLFERSAQDERLVAIGLCSDGDLLLQRTARFPSNLDCPRARAIATQSDPQLSVPGGSVHVGVHDVVGRTVVESRPPGAADGPRSRLGAGRGRRGGPGSRRPPPPPRPTPRHWPAAGAAARPELHRAPQPGHPQLPDRPDHGAGPGDAFITVVVAQLSWRGWVKGARALMRGEGLLSPLLTARPNSRPLPPTCGPGCATWRTSTGARRAPTPNGPPNACARCCAPSSAATRSSWCPTASPTSTSTAPTASSSSVRPAAW
jgi:hypothetical protein